MPTIDEVSRQIADGAHVDEIRLGLGELIGHHLRAFNETGSLGYWEKEHLAHAIATLAMNIRSGRESVAWLRLCLTDIMKALVPPEQRDENYTPKDPLVEALTFDQLLRDLRAVGG
jgi:hypothetical protein